MKCFFCYTNYMKEVGQYDSALNMFVEKPRPLKLNRLIFERYMAQSGRGEHHPVGVPAGELALALVIREGLPIEQALRSVYRRARNGKMDTAE